MQSRYVPRLLLLLLKDVYKRQYILTTLRAQDINWSLFPQALKNTAEKRGSYSHLLETGDDITVSYTHLDVYKRQVIDIPEREQQGVELRHQQRRQQTV